MTLDEIRKALFENPKLWEQLKSNDLDEELSRSLPTYIATGKNGSGPVMPVQFLTMGSVKGTAVRICKLGEKINRDGTKFVPTTRKSKAAAKTGRK